MQQYKRPEAIKRMNELAGSRKPFLFIIDYKQQCSLIEEISRIDSTRCRYNFNGVKNVDTVTVTKEMTFYLFPPNRSMALIMIKKLCPMSWLHSLLLIVEFLWFNVVNFLVNLFVRF